MNDLDIGSCSFLFSHLEETQIIVLNYFSTQLQLSSATNLFVCFESYCEHGPASPALHLASPWGALLFTWPPLSSNSWVNTLGMCYYMKCYVIIRRNQLIMKPQVPERFGDLLSSDRKWESRLEHCLLTDNRCRAPLSHHEILTKNV